MKQGRTFWDFLSEVDPFWLLMGVIFTVGTISSTLIAIFGAG